MDDSSTKEILVGQLVKLRGVIRDAEVVDILLVAHDVKPGALFDLTRPESVSPAQLGRYKKRVQALGRILKGFGLYYVLFENRGMTTKTVVTRFSCVARSKTMLQKLVMAEREKSAAKRRLVLGKLLGYPRTAYTAFANRTVARVLDLPTSITRRGYFKFLNIRLSKKHWRKELVYARKRANAIQRISPKLYKRITKN